MVQCSRGSGSVPVSFMLAMLGCTKHPSVGTHWARQRLVTAEERVGNGLMVHREHSLDSQRGMLLFSLFFNIYLNIQKYVQRMLNSIGFLCMGWNFVLSVLKSAQPLEKTWVVIC